MSTRRDFSDEQVRVVEEWFREGRTLEWMRSEALSRWGLDLSVTAWSRWRSSVLGGPVLNYRLSAVPWLRPVGAKRDRRINLLRVLARHEAGEDVSSAQLDQALLFQAQMDLDGTVVDYDYESDRTVLVPRRMGVDDWYIRNPFLTDDGSEVPIRELPPVHKSALMEWRRRNLG